MTFLYPPDIYIYSTAYGNNLLHLPPNATAQPPVLTQRLTAAEVRLLEKGYFVSACMKCECVCAYFFPGYSILTTLQLSECYIRLNPEVSSNFLKIIFMCGMDISLHVCLCVVCMPGSCGSQERKLDVLGLELQVVMSGYVVLGTEAGSFGGAARTFHPWAISPAP